MSQGANSSSLPSLHMLCQSVDALAVVVGVVHDEAAICEGHLGVCSFIHKNPVRAVLVLLGKVPLSACFPHVVCSLHQSIRCRLCVL